MSTDLAPVSIEHALIVRVRNGDAGAFRRIFDRYGSAVRRLCGDILRDPAAADEATQEIFVRAYKMIPSLRDGAKLRPWLLGIGRNVCYERLRVRKKRKRETEWDDADDSTASVGAAPSPRDELLRREADAMLDTALSTLPADRRTALVLRLDHGLGYEHIATELGWSVARVKNEIHRARITLRRELKRYLEGES